MFINNFISKMMDIFNNLKKSLIELKNNKFMIFIGITESFFLGMMFIFIFCWTPRLQYSYDKTDTSEVFTLFMFSLTVGGSLFKVNLIHVITNTQLIIINYFYFRRFTYFSKITQ